jgi:hypothetical protein
MDLPDEPEAGTRAVVSSGAVGSTEAVFLDPGAHLLDAAFGRWETMPAIPGDGDEVVRELVAIGTDAFTFGSDDDRLALADGWIWRSGRQPQPEPQPVTPTPTSSTAGETTTSATSSTTAADPTSTSTGSTTTTIATIPTTVGPGSTGQGWRDDPVVANSPVCVPGELPPGVDGSSPIYFWNLGDPFEGRLDLITGSTVYTAVDCSWIPVLDLEREPGVRDWRCQQYEDGSEIELWDFTEGAVTEFPAGGGNGPMENYQRPDQLFGLASCDRSNPRNAAPSV